MNLYGIKKHGSAWLVVQYLAPKMIDCSSAKFARRTKTISQHDSMEAAAEAAEALRSEAAKAPPPFPSAAAPHRSAAANIFVFKTVLNRKEKMTHHEYHAHRPTPDVGLRQNPHHT